MAAQNETQRLLDSSKEKYNELKRRVAYLKSEGAYGTSRSLVMQEIGAINGALLRLKDFMSKLTGAVSQEYVQNLMKKYENATDEKILVGEMPSLKEAYYLTGVVEQKFGHSAKVAYNQYQLPDHNALIDKIHKNITKATHLNDLLKGKEFFNQVYFNLPCDYDTEQRLQNEYKLLVDKIITASMEKSPKEPDKDPNPTPSMSAEVGNTPDGVRSLIHDNQYFGVLQAIPASQAEKYRDFINTGFRAMFNRLPMESFDQLVPGNEAPELYQNCQNCYQNLREIFDNFKDYVPLEAVNSMKTALEAMEGRLRQCKPQKEIIGVRNNSSKAAVQQPELAREM